MTEQRGWQVFPQKPGRHWEEGQSLDGEWLGLTTGYAQSKSAAPLLVCAAEARSRG